MNDFIDYYRLFDIKSDASDTEIKAKYRKLAMIHHPDKGGDPEKMKIINEGYEILSSPERRAVYDVLYKAYCEYVVEMFKDILVKKINSSDGKVKNTNFKKHSNHSSGSSIHNNFKTGSNPINSERERLLNKIREASKEKMFIGLMIFIGGVILTFFSMTLAYNHYIRISILFYGAIIYGGYDFFKGAYYFFFPAQLINNK